MQNNPAITNARFNYRLRAAAWLSAGKTSAVRSSDSTQMRRRPSSSPDCRTPNSTSAPKKKRKLDADSDADESPAQIICEHCSGAVPQISLRVACLDGTTLKVTVPERGLVHEVKSIVGQVGQALHQESHVNTLFPPSCATWTRV